MSLEVRSGIELPALREAVSFEASDGAILVGELALPLSGQPAVTLLTMHPNPLQGGNMDSHIIRKLAGRLPALANIGVLRFNTRGTSSPRGTSTGEHGYAQTERYDLQAAAEFLRARGLSAFWLVGWSFGTDVILKWGRQVPDALGVILLSPPLMRVTESELLAWREDPRPVWAFVPEFDTFLSPAAARERFSVTPNVAMRAFDEAKHLWVGETQTSRVIDAIVEVVRPEALPLARVWEGPLRDA